MFFTEDEAREAIRLYPHLTNEMKLSGQALDTYLYVRVMRDKGMTATHLMKGSKFSLQHASQVLKSLFKKGYCSRHEVPQKSGGYEFVYIALNPTWKPSVGGDSHLQEDLLK